jgi:hypothetical protein
MLLPNMRNLKFCGKTYIKLSKIPIPSCSTGNSIVMVTVYFITKHLVKSLSDQILLSMDMRFGPQIKNEQ